MIIQPKKNYIKSKMMSYKSDTCSSKHVNSPLTTYSSAEEAVYGENYINSEYGNDLVAYKCDNCENWHLSPKNRSTKCYMCTDGHGNNKYLYVTKNDAQIRADILYQERGVLLNSYQCPHKNG